MARISGTNIPENKHVVISLTEIFGIGRSKSKDILKALNIKEDAKLKDLPESRVDDIRAEIAKHQVEGELRSEISMNIKRQKDIGSFKGIRHRKGLPVNGQRTKTNARTRRGPRKAIKK